MCGCNRPENPVDVAVDESLRSEGWKGEDDGTDTIVRTKTRGFDIADAYLEAKAKAQREMDEANQRASSNQKVMNIY